MKKISRSFFARNAQIVAADLIGAILVQKNRRDTRRARIVETEAYVGPHDLACHASKGRTNRTEIMFGPAGHAYVYLIYGMYDMLNIVTGKPGDAQAVLIRAAEPLDDWDADLSGPGKLTRAFNITVKNHSGLDLTGNVMYLTAGPKSLDGKPIQLRQTPRIGIEYAGPWQHEPLRFIDPHSRAVSGPKHLRGPAVHPVTGRKNS